MTIETTYVGGRQPDWESLLRSRRFSTLVLRIDRIEIACTGSIASLRNDTRKVASRVATEWTWHDGVHRSHYHSSLPSRSPMLESSDDESITTMLRDPNSNFPSLSTAAEPDDMGSHLSH